MLFLFTFKENAFADAVSIKGATKVYRNGSYLLLINYETRDKWTDHLVFKVHCKFDKEDFVFTSSSLNNIERGWHKTKIPISSAIRKRYGSLREYKIALYRDGMLIDTR
ncbi:hypothetical protein ACFL0P_01815 [Candidatus Omnitrophota bacterium]